MNDPARAQFLAERADILGGSDMVHLLGLEPFGCQRRLCYDKTGIVADFPFEGNADTERGARLEGVAVEEYERATGRTCFWRQIVRGQEPWEACHIDREIHADGQYNLGDYGPGVLEVKIPSSWNYQILARQPELPETYRVQLQWGLAVTGWEWGSIWVWTPDKWQGRFEDYGRDDAAISLLRRIAKRFWEERHVWVEKKEYQTDPFPHIERLDPSDRRCTVCPWRRKCQGLGEMPREVLDDATQLSQTPAITDESIAPLVEQYAEVRARLRQAEDEKKQVGEALELAMGDRQRVVCARGKVSYTDVAACEYKVKREAGKRLTVRSSNGG